MEAPFYIGQEIVCIKQHQSGFLKINQDYTVTDIYQCDKCKRRSVCVGIEIYCYGIVCGCGLIDLREISDAPFPVLLFAPKESKKSTMSFEDAIKLVTSKKLEKV